MSETYFAAGNKLPAPIKLNVMRLEEDAQLPVYATEGAACLDLHAYLKDTQGAFVQADASGSQNATLTIRTALAFEVPPGWMLLIFSRSGQGFKENTRLANCTGNIDSDYRGEVRVKLTRDDGGGLTVQDGDRIAQAVLVPAPRLELVEVEELSETVRGQGGYGSTGK